MKWDELLRCLRRAGYKPTEEDFMEDYGSVAAERPEELRGRHFRYTFGAARIGSLRFEGYVFPSEGDAEDFRDAVHADGGWYRRGNMVFHVTPRDMNQLIEVLEAVLEGRA